MKIPPSILASFAVLASPASAQPLTVQGAAAFPGRILAAHNAVRRDAALPPLRWDDELGTAAAAYAVQLAASGTFSHSTTAARGGTGENLWMGTRGAFTVEQMVGGWASEKRLFVAGVFPNVTRNGNWHDIGHYTQIVWPTTQRVGCALARNAAADYLVCRYSPAGNVYGVSMRAR